MSSANSSLIRASAPTSETILALIQQNMPGGVAVPADEPKEAVARTEDFIKEDNALIYGAAFAFNGFVAVVDVLLKRQERWHAYLFRPSTRIKETHLVDAALHEHILRKAGLSVGEVSLLLLNAAYIRQGALSPQQLFIEERVGKRLPLHYPAIHGRMAMVRRMAAQKRKREGQKFSSSPAALKTSLQEASLAKEPPPVSLEVDRAQLAGFAASLQYPLYFMDFEAYQTAVPEWDGHWPFRQIPFQFSMHRLEAPGGDLHHEGFIVPPGIEPTKTFGEALLKAMGEQGTVLVYNIDSERLILDQLQRSHPQLRFPIESLRNRLVDLMTPFSQAFIRIPSIGNKLSLKYILPAMVPGMSHAALEIGDGKDVNEAYNAIRHSTDTTLIETTKAALLAYCEVDTLAMVRILERMRELVG